MLADLLKADDNVLNVRLFLMSGSDRTHMTTDHWSANEYCSQHWQELAEIASYTLIEWLYTISMLNLHCKCGIEVFLKWHLGVFKQTV